ncbi:choice-of-anchor E domain-containing protein [Taibaiella koreensis]|uniref:choice-of-anchor E domain-containing protein n=1 Tax=Taibaiella koreensis TaxID=1268548 RepID=UPI000E599853|nr:choice-of-anchor E domain-containing protein [Taibaiella koreensis]
MNRKFLHGLLFSTGMLAGSSAMAQAPYNTITGFVWKEQGTQNNVKDGSETGVRGIMVTLIDAISGATVGNALSDSLGNYTLNNFRGTGDYVLQFDYPVAGYDLVDQRAGSDNLLNSAADPATAQTAVFTISDPDALTGYNLGVAAKANTITYASSKPFTLTDWNEALLLPKSDSAIGVLTKATIYINSTEWHPYFGVENTSDNAVSTSPSAGIQVAITPPVGTAINVTNSILHTNTSLAAYDGTTDYNGNSGHTWSNEFASVVGTPRTITLASQLNAFRGSGSVSFPINSQGTVTLTGGGNLLSQISTQLGVSVSIVYEYAGGILPVDFKSFTATPQHTDVNLDWITATETNNKAFEILRSVDGKTFDVIGSLQSLAANGNSFSDLKYRFVDKNVPEGNLFYRIKQIDKDGRYSFSPIRQIAGSGATKTVLYPNPATGTVNIIAGGEGQVTIRDLSGKLVQRFVIGASGMLAIDLSHCTNGLYFVAIQTAKGTETQKLEIRN